MSIEIVRRAPRFILLVGALILTAAGCAALVSERPIFASGDYDGASLLGHYSRQNERGSELELVVATDVLVTRGPDEQIKALGFEYKVEKQSEGPKIPVLSQTFYAEGAAIPLGDGDFVLQITCSALVKDGNVYASWIGGKASPYRTYTVYGTFVQDRKKSYGWVNAYVGTGEGPNSDSDEYADAANLFFNKYRIERGTTKGKTGEAGQDVRIIPSDIARPAALSLFRELGAGPLLYRRIDRRPEPTDDENQAIVLNSSEACYRVQTEGDPPPEKREAPEENAPPPPPK